MKLKEKLLSMQFVVDNEYLDKYVSLIESNLKTEKQRFKTQRHHIVPRYYYRLNKMTLDNSRDNVINLQQRDHLLAHIFLSLCSSSDLYSYNNSIALNYMTKKIDFNDEYLEKYQREYELSRQCNSKFNVMFDEKVKDKHKEAMRSEETRKKISNKMKENLANGLLFTDEIRKKISSSQKGYINLFKDGEIKRVLQKNYEIVETLKKDGWTIYERRTYDQLCGREPMTELKQKTNKFTTRGVGCYCILNTGERYDFNDILDASIWWYNTFKPFGDKFSVSTYQRKIKRSINNEEITYNSVNGTKIKSITNIKWFKLNLKGGDVNEKVN